MRNSDRNIAVARKVERDTPVRDTWPVPPPSPSSDPGSDWGALEEALEGAHDTIPTPPPESGIVEPVAIPPLRSVDVGEKRR